MTVLYLRFHRMPRDVYGQLFTVLEDISPLVQALPPEAALIDVTGALGYFRRSPAELADLLQTRLLARYGLHVTIGAGPNRMLAVMAAGTCPPGEVHVLPDDPRALAAFLDERPVQELPGIGPALTRALTGYGLTRVGALRALPLPTLQRIAGATTGRLLHERANGVDPRPVVPQGSPVTVSVTRGFDRDVLDPATVRQALLELAVDLGSRLRGARQAARTVELHVRYADRSTTTRSRTLPEATNHTPALQNALYQIFASLGLQRARLRAVTARAGQITAAERTSVQLTLHQPTEDARTLEPTIDRANHRFGNGALVPASLVGPPVTGQVKAAHDRTRWHNGPGSPGSQGSPGRGGKMRSGSGVKQ